MIIYFLILVNHFFADFLFQTDKMATKKSTSNKWLSVHALTYILVMSPIGMYLDYEKYGHIMWFSWGVGFSWWIINLILHWCTDYCTSRLTSYLWVKGINDPNGSWMGGSWRHWFFSVVGADQLTHTACLFFTYQYFIQ